MIYDTLMWKFYKKTNQNRT